MSSKICLVATTIGDGSFLDDYAKVIKNEGLSEEITVIIIPDRKTPSKLFDKCAEMEKLGFMYQGVGR